MAAVLYTLAVLAWPVGVGLMMFVMRRGQNKGSANQAGSAADSLEAHAVRAEIEALKAESTVSTSQHPQP
jgi:hypothetical protein